LSLFVHAVYCIFYIFFNTVGEKIIWHLNTRNRRYG